MRLLLVLILCLSPFFLYDVPALSSDGVTLLSLLTHWTFVPPPINSTWSAFDSTPCFWAGVKCDHNHNVVSLNLTAYGIVGQLSPQISHLNHLQIIILVANRFSGKIPSELSNCSQLEYLDLSENIFSQQIPYSLNKLQNLRCVSFSSNLLSGEIPETLFQIRYLRELYLDNNSLSGPIPKNIGNMTQLLRLYLYGNQLSGSIPSSIGYCSKLEALFLNDNRLAGILPERLNDLRNLVYLDVKNNSLAGTISLGSGSCESLYILDLSFNVFSGGIPSGLGNCSGLAELAVAHNNLEGTIPSSLGLLHKLLILRLPENHLSGKIPPEIGNCKSLKKLHMFSNQLEGEIPKELGMLSELEDLELSFNHLMGEIPVSIWNIPSLKYILVHNNSLSGRLPLEMTELKHLKNISLYDNRFSGVIPQSLGINSSLVRLDLMNNKFRGNIPPNLCFGKQLHLLNMGLNQLQGRIPPDLGRCATLTRLDLRGNNLNGPLPDFERNMTLIYMDMSENNISGAIPSSIGNCRNLTEINLSTNKFAGLLPPELGNLVNLMVLNLAHNNLEGPLQPQLSNCTQMESFDVGFNFLNGSLPSGLKSWTGLTALILRGNRFTGGIPDFLSEFDKLLELQLGGNLFAGEIPKSIGALQNLFYELNLSANGLTGKIPSEIGKLKRLQKLDISLNNLTGTTDVLSELPSLLEVNISYNSFVGSVPKMLMKFLDSSPSAFLGNPSLCVSCLPSGGQSCPKSHYFKPCNNKSFGHEGITRVEIVMIELGFSLFISSMLVGLVYIYLRRGFRQELSLADKEESIFSESEVGVIGQTYRQSSSLVNDVMKATENLNDRYVIGRGGHGIVYKVQLDRLPGYVFAMKKIDFKRKERRKTSMYREIEIVKKIEHTNVISCHGLWIGEAYGLIFYSYIENGSLHDVLHEMNPHPPLPWRKRCHIAFGIAQGLEYLHYKCHPPIVHRDIKPRNILLDSDMKPYIIDFGISMRLYQCSTVMRMQSAYNVGTLGYIAPETANAVVRSAACDVYSYGVVLLELITRKKVLDESFMEKTTTLVAWVRSVWEETEDIEKIVDPSLAKKFPALDVKEQVIIVLLLALKCTDRDPHRRPTMRGVINALCEAVIDVGKWVHKRTPPLKGFIRLNIECSEDYITRETSAGGVFSDSRGHWVVGYAKHVGFGVGPLAELWAALLGLQIAVDRHMYSLTIETRSPFVCRLLRSHTYSDLSIHLINKLHGLPRSNINSSINGYDPLIESCRALLRQLREHRILYIRKEINIWADHMAKLGMQLPNSEVSIFDSCPCSAETCVLADVQGVCCPSSVVLRHNE